MNSGKFNLNIREYKPSDTKMIMKLFYDTVNEINTALPDVMRYKNPTPNPLRASDEGAKMYLIRAEPAVFVITLFSMLKQPVSSRVGVGNFEEIILVTYTQSITATSL